MDKVKFLGIHTYIAGHGTPTVDKAHTESAKMWRYFDEKVRSHYSDKLSIATSPREGKEYHWMYTPIDDYANFENNKAWASMSMLWVEGKPFAAALYVPKYESLITVSDSQASIRLNNKAFKPAKKITAKEPTIALDATGNPFAPYTIRYLQNDGYDRYSVTNSPGADICDLITGSIHGYITQQADMYKMFPLIFICEKAGFVVTNAAGKEPTPMDTTIVIGINKKVHADLLHAATKI